MGFPAARTNVTTSARVTYAGSCQANLEITYRVVGNQLQIWVDNNMIDQIALPDPSSVKLPILTAKEYSAGMGWKIMIQLFNQATIDDQIKRYGQSAIDYFQSIKKFEQAATSNGFVQTYSAVCYGRTTDSYLIHFVDLELYINIQHVQLA